MRKVLTLTLLFICGDALATGIPVFDAANVVQAIQSVQQLKAQLDEQKRIYQAMNGSRGMGTLLNNPSLKNYLPQDWQKVYEQLSKGDLSGLTGSAAEIRKSSTLYECAKLTSANSRIMCARQAGKVAQDKAYGLDAYQQAQSRISQIEGLMSKINATTDAKAIAELNARIQAENALIQNEQIKLQMFQYLSQVEDRAIQQQNYERRMELRSRPSAGKIQIKNFE